MNKNDKVILASSAIFTAVALMHLVRLITGASLAIGGEEVAMWMSVFSLILGAALAILNCRMIDKLTGAHWAKFFMFLFLIDAVGVFYSWIAGLSYWGFSNSMFGWFTIFDIIVVIILSYYSKKLSKASIM